MAAEIIPARFSAASFDNVGTAAVLRVGCPGQVILPIQATEPASLDARTSVSPPAHMTP